MIQVTVDRHATVAHKHGRLTLECHVRNGRANGINIVRRDSIPASQMWVAVDELGHLLAALNAFLPMVEEAVERTRLQNGECA